MSLVSVYIPTKNRLASLQKAIESVLAQTHPEVEVIVTDDASTDGTWDYLQRLAAQEPRVRCLRHETSRGACAARNAAIRVARGNFLTGLDDDDEFLPDHLASLVAYWALLTADGGRPPACLFTQTLNRLHDRVAESRKRAAVTHHDLVDLNHIGNQIFAPRAHFLSAGLFNEAMPAWQDLEFFYRVVKAHGTARLLDKATYVFDVTPRPDRISVGQKDRILRAARLMASLHGGGDRRFTQRLLLQVYGEHYGFPIGPRDLWGFCALAPFSLHSARLGKRYLHGLARRTLGRGA